MGRITLMVVTISALVAWLAYQYPDAAISPGKLSLAHYQTTSSCLNCHVLFRGASNSKCLECHDQAKIGLFNVEGKPVSKEKKRILFHQGLDKDSCLTCHTEHQGRDVPKSIAEFKHDALVKSMNPDCTNCHETPVSAIHNKITENCSHCHITESWLPQNFDHSAYFRFDKNHDNNCSSCHSDNKFSDYSCFGCHEHSEKKLEEEHLEEGIDNFTSCVECHRSGNEDDAERIWTTKRKRNILKEGKFHRSRSKKYKKKYHDDLDDDRHEHKDEEDDD